MANEKQEIILEQLRTALKSTDIDEVVLIGRSGNHIFFLDAKGTDAQRSETFESLSTVMSGMVSELLNPANF